AAVLVAEMVKTSIGPRGMDKMLVDSVGDVTITNDGAAMLKEVLVSHPIAKMLVHVAKATDYQVGDGTTSAMLLTGALLQRAEELMDRGIHPTLVAKGYTLAKNKAIESLREIAETVPALSHDWLM